MLCKYDNYLNSAVINILLGRQFAELNIEMRNKHVFRSSLKVVRVLASRTENGKESVFYVGGPATRDERSPLQVRVRAWDWCDRSLS